MPLFSSMGRQVSYSQAIRLGGFAWLGEERDELASLTEFLLGQSQYYPKVLQRSGKTQSKRPDHTAPPGRRIKVSALRQAQKTAEADTFKGGIVCPLLYGIISKSCQNIRRNLFSTGAIDDMHRAIVNGVGEEQDFKGEIFGIAVNTAFGKLSVTVGFKVDMNLLH